LRETAGKERQHEAVRIEKIAMAIMAAGGLPLTAGVLGAILYLVLTLASLISVGPDTRLRLETATSAKILEAGREKE
jgi:hypothetical protein